MIMKVGITISCEKFDFPYIVYNGVNTDEVYRKLSSYGYDCVDFFAGDLPQQELKKISTSGMDNGIKIANYLPIGLTKKGFSLTDRDIAKRRYCIEGYFKEIEKAALLDADYITIGTARGNLQKDMDKSCYYELLAESVDRVCDFAKEAGVIVCIEAINRLEVNALNSAIECTDFLNRYNLSEAKLLLDVFHLNIEEKNICKSILYAKDKIAHFHIEDTNRLFPGGGHADYMEIFNTLREIEYDNSISIEAAPIPNSDECAKQSIEYLKNYF